MTVSTGLIRARLALFAATALTAAPALAQETAITAEATDAREIAALENQFRDPPNSARPRVWWHWMNGNVSKDGIAKDMAWMKRVGIGGMQNFDANLSTPQVVDKRLVYMTPEWKDAFRFTAAEADRQGLELAIAASPGWSETGGPWVKPEDAMKKLVWSETEIEGGKRFTGKLAPPPGGTGPFQDMPKAPSIDELMNRRKDKPAPTAYGDAAVIAYPIGAARRATPLPHVRDGTGTLIASAAMFDSDLASAVAIAPTGDAPPMMVIEYPAPQTVQSARIYLPGAWFLFMGGLVAPKLEAELGGAWRTVAEIPSGPIPTTVSFAPVTAQRFRMTFPPRTAGFAAFQNDPSPGVTAVGMPNVSAMAGKRPVQVGEFRLSGEARVDRFEAKAGFSVEPDYYALTSNAPETAGVAPERVIDLTARMQPDGTLDWTPPKGRWRVARLGWSLIGTTNHPAPEEATGLEVDKFDGAAVRRYLNHYLDMYTDASGGLIGKRGVRALLTDSIEVGASNWTPRLIAQFKHLRGYDPTPWLPVLTGAVIGSRARSDAFLYDYRRTLADLLASQHYGVVAAVAHERGLKVYGEALENGRPSLGDDMAMRRHADIPMSAMWTHSRQAGPRPAHLADIKGAASVAHIYGQNLVATEALTSAANFWDHGPAYLKRVADVAFVSGMNRPVIHTSVHQPVDDKQPGLSLGMFGQFFNRHDAWAELAKPWVDYLSRHSLMLQQGRNVADVAYFYGEEAPLASLYQTQVVADAPKGYAYDFLNFDALTGALTNDGDSLTAPGGARYRAIYLGGTARRMTLPALRKLAALVEAGATVIGPKPERDPGMSSDAAQYNALTARMWPGGAQTALGKGVVIAGTDVDAALGAIGVTPAFTYSGAAADAQIPFVHRRFADGESWFLVNRGARAETIEARFRVAGKVPELWRAETGQSTPLSYRIEQGVTVVPLTLAADDAYHVVFRKAATAPALQTKAPPATELARLDGPWSVSFQLGRGAPARATLPTLAPLDENADPGIKYFSGVATYTRDFTAPRGWKSGQPLWLDLGEAREVAEVLINGKTAGYAWHAPYRIDIGAFVKPGRNRIETRVANLWVNRLIGDAQPGARPVAWTSQPSYRADAPLRRSGLIGPVRLMSGE